MEEFPVWFSLLGLPIQFWTNSTFSSIGNILDKFLDIEKAYLHSHGWSAAHILISLNPREGLVDAMLLKYGGLEFIQTLDYENLPFRCHHYHFYGHLAQECPLRHRHCRRQRKNGNSLEEKKSKKVISLKEEAQVKEL